ncbi:MAG TPA: glycosyltransferase [Patescibacteria group bacterium]|nr:glycosyltransferase [Patescibacteria group bacterium]
MSVRRNIDIVFFDAASGHRSSAVALKKALDERFKDLNVRAVNIVDIFDHYPTFGKIVHTGIRYFNWQIKNDIVFDLKGLIKLSIGIQDSAFTKGTHLVAKFWKDAPPDLVVSVTPMYNPVLFKSAQVANPAVKCVTIPVDFEEVMPRYWFTPAVEQYYLNATPRLQLQAQSARISENFLHQLGGMIADPDSYIQPQIDKKAELRKLKLDENLPTGFVSFGGQGSTQVLKIAHAMVEQNISANVIFMCGKNEKLFKKLTALQTPFKKAVFSYLQETPIHYLHLADFAIGKPGAMTITEALITGTPLIAIKSRGMSPVQRGNEEWMIETRTGIVAENAAQVPVAITEILKSDVFTKNIEAHRHRAVFEAAEKIAQLID